MAIQGPRPGPYPSNSATIADLPRPTSPDLQTDSDDDATSSDSDEDHPIANGRKNAGKEEPTVRRDLDSRKPPPKNRDEEDLVRAVQERIRVQSLLYDAPSSTTTTRQQSPGPPPISRAHLRLALSTLRARHSLASRSFSHLSTALNEISKALLSLGGSDALAKPMLERRIGPLDATASTKPNFGIFSPILARLVKDVRTTLSAEEVMGREFRRSNLSREEAKALVALRQRWVVKPAGGKPTGREGKRDRKDSEWVDTVEKLVAEHPPPACLLTPSTNAHEDPLEAEAEDPQTASLLTSSEQLLLPAALPRISLSNLDLDDHDLADWPALEGVEEIVRWYLSFGYAPGQRQEDMGEEEDKARKTLDGVKVLDLSHNRLADFPRHLVHLFPNLEALSLSHNRFTRLPPWITLFSSLRRLETNHNSLVSSSRDDPARTRTSRAAVGKGKGKGEENDGGDGVRANAREMYKLVEAAVRRTVTRVSRAELLRSLHCRRGNSTARTAAATGRILEPPPPPLRSLFSLSVELAQTHLLSSPSQREICTLDDALSMMIPPPHLLEAVTTSYRCNSCDRFVTTMPDDAAWFVPPFWERVHFLTPGIVVPSSHGLRRRDRRRRRRRGEAERGDEDEEDDDDGEEGEEHVEHLDVDSSSALSGRGDSGAVKSATLEQRLLLAVLARQEQGSLPPPPPDRGPQRSSGTSGGGGGHKKKNAASSSSRFFDSDYGRRSRSTDHDGNADDPAAAPTEGTGATFTIGGRGPHGVGFRFCSLCAASHLGVRHTVLANLAPAALGVSEGYEDGGADVVASWRCGCEMCEEERRVRGTASEVEEDNVDERRKVVRWLRRYDAVR